MATQPRRHRTDEELKIAAQRLLQEVRTLRATCHVHTHGIPGNRPPRATLESFAIHARVLVHFLFPDGTVDPDDILAEDFFATGAKQAAARGAKLPKALEKVRPAVANEIIHLNYARLPLFDEAKTWDCAAITNQINAAMKQFAENADRLDLDVKRELSRPESETRAAIQDP